MWSRNPLWLSIVLGVLLWSSSTLAFAKPDLTISDYRIAVIKRTSTLDLRGEYLVSFRLQNAGTAAGPFKVRFYYTRTLTSSLSSAKYLGVEFSRQGLGGSQTSDLNGIAVSFANLSSPISSGYILTVVDFDNKVSESNESNNAKTLSLPRGGSATGPDLQVQLSTVPNVGTPGNKLSVTTTVSNKGLSASSGMSSLLYFLCKTSQPLQCYKDGNLIQAYRLSNLQVARNGTQTFQHVLPIHSNWATGLYYIHAFVDGRHQIPESNEQNNYGTKTITLITVSQILPNLQVSATNPSSLTTRGAGGLVYMSITLRNNGSADAGPFNVSLYYGDTNGGPNFTLLKTLSQKGLQKKSTEVVKTSFQMPPNVLYGSRVIQIVTDVGNMVQESNEQDNRHFVPIKVTGLPNLQVSFVKLTPNVVSVGDGFQIRADVRNTGYSRVGTSTGAAVVTELSYWLSKDTVIDISDQLLTKQTIKLNLNVGTTNSYQFKVALPSNLTAGKYNIGAWIDSGVSKIQETVETDNTRHVPLTVNPGANIVDLQMISLAHKTNGTTGMAVLGRAENFVVTVRNVGLKTAANYRIRLYYTGTQAVIDSNSILLGTSGPITSHAPSTNRTETITLTPPKTLSADYRYLVAIADEVKASGDTNLSNNKASLRMLFIIDKDGDKSYWAFNCPSAVRACDCNDNDKTVRPGIPEVCDGKDNNCNKQIDETFPNKNKVCSIGTGACAATGKYVCSSTGKSTQCNAKAGSPSAEVCDGKDNNCNGRIDENIFRKCYSGTPGTAGKGDCTEGNQSCVGAKWSACIGEKLPKTEICDGKDNDCDGSVDETCACQDGKTQPCGTSQGVCTQGKQTCSGGKWGACTGGVKGSAELCDGLDNNCNGQVDEPFTDKGKACSIGQGACKAEGRLVCNKAKNGTTCNAKPRQPQKEICGDAVDNDCDGQIDNPELCNDAGGEKIPEISPDSGECPTCADGEFCWEGKCRKTCGCLKCPGKDQICEFGVCVTNKCAVVDCQDGYTCIASTGKCVLDPCDTIQCPGGTQCRLGQCNTVHCSEPTEEKSSKPGAEPSADSGEPRVYDFQLDLPTNPPGGCGCSTSAPLWPFWSLLLLLFVWRRKRRLQS